MKIRNKIDNGKTLLLVHTFGKIIECKGKYYPKQVGGFHTTNSLRRFEGHADKILFLGMVEHVDDVSLIKELSSIEYEAGSLEYISPKNNSLLSKIIAIKTALKRSSNVIVRLPSFIGSLVAIYAKILGVCCIVEVVGNGYEALKYHSCRGRIVAPFFDFFDKLAIRKSPYVSYITKKYLQGVYPTRGVGVDFIPNVSFSTEELVSGFKNRLDRIKCKSRDNVFRIGMVGCYTVRYKAHDTLLKAFKHFLVTHKLESSNIVLELVGSRDNSRLLRIAKKLGIESYVVFKKSIPHEKIFDWLDTVDIYVQPSRTEAQGRAVVEAMSRGCHVITSNIGGMRELIERKFRFQVDNYKQLSVLLYTAYSSYTIIEKACYRNNKFVSDHFLDQDIDLRRNEFYKEVFK